MKYLRWILLILGVAVFCIASPISGFASGNALPCGLSGRQVYIGGFPIGITVDIGGLLVDGVTGVETEFGTAEVEGLKRGDIIKKINGKEVVSVDDVAEILTDECATIELIRAGKTLSVEVKPLIDAYSGRPRLGVRIKEKLYGIGTVSFVGVDGSYAALGHEIFDSETNTHIPFSSGNIHECKLLGIKKGKKGDAGALLGTLIADSVIGTVECNNRFGIAGRYSEKRPADELVEVASRSEVSPGAAKIRTTVDSKPEYYDIEIIKASQRGGRNEKSIVFRVTDKRLLNMTGGVVRGMSGSPILQNGKLVGAVTHVFLNDFTKGYGIYADCLNEVGQ